MKVALLLLGVACLAGFGMCTKYHRNQYGRTSLRPHEECNKVSLMNYLFSPKRYSPTCRPKDGEGPVTVEHRYELIRLVNLHFDWETDFVSTKLLCLDVWEYFSWNDPRLSWNTDKCNVTGPLRMPLDKLWVPDVGVDKSAGPMPDKIERNTARVHSNGDVVVAFNRQIKTYCDPIVVSGTEAGVPGDLDCGDEFKCEIPVNSWTLLDDDLKLTVGEPGGGMGLTELTGSSTLFYSVINTTSTVVSKQYPSFSGNIDTIIYTVWLRFFGPEC